MAELKTLEAAAEEMRDTTRKAVRRNSMQLLIQDALLVLAAILALIYPLLTNVALAVFFG